MVVGVLFCEGRFSTALKMWPMTLKKIKKRSCTPVHAAGSVCFFGFCVESVDESDDNNDRHIIAHHCVVC